MAEERYANGEIIVTGIKPRRFSLDTFRSEISRNDIISPHSYLVTLAPFKKASLNQFSDLLTMRCDSAILPSVNFLTDDNVRRYGYGPVETVVHGVQFGQIRLTWILDKDARVIQFFDRWFAEIINFDSKGGADMRSSREFNNFDPYELGYKDDYSNSKMSIFVYDRAARSVMNYEIFDAFPKLTEDIPLSWGEMDSAIRYSVTFAFTDINISITNEVDDFDRSIHDIIAKENALRKDTPRGNADTYSPSYNGKEN